MPENYWKTKAQQVIAEGYRPKNPWERQLLRHLTKFFPKLLLELQNLQSVNAYLIVTVSRIMDLEDRMLDQGVDPQDARTLALQELFPNPPEDEDRPANWEVESGVDSQTGVARQLLLSGFSKPRPRQTTLPI